MENDDQRSVTPPEHAPTAVASLGARQPTRDNHFVPQTLLRRWSSDGRYVWAYRLLVSSEQVPVWQLRSLKGVGLHRDLYSDTGGESNIDELEQWFNQAVEQPATAALDRVESGKRLRRSDWESLVRLFAAQHVRTPQRFAESMARWQSGLPELLRLVISHSLERAAEAQRTGRPLRLQPPDDDFKPPMKTRIERPPDGSGEPVIAAEILAGRALWLQSMKHVLTGRPIDVLLRHKWSVASLPAGIEIPLTDDPALTLGYRSPAEYWYGAGWKTRRADLLLPLTPRHVLYANVGKDSGRRFELTNAQALQVRRFVAERAHRWIFSRSPQDWISEARPRAVSSVRFAEEASLWQEWHRSQLTAEQSLFAN